MPFMRMGDEVALRRDGALRPAGRARGVHDRRVVVGSDVDIGKGWRVELADGVLERLSVGHVAIGAGQDDVAYAVSPRCGAMRSARSSSANRTTAPESLRPYASSGPVHQAFSGTVVAPTEMAAQNASAHSG